MIDPRPEDRGARERALVWTAIAALGVLAGLGAMSLPSPSSGAPGTREAGIPPAAAPDGASGLLYGRPLDLNRASADSLEALPGIGPGRAAAIVATRRQGRFERVEDLERVPGIGPRTRAGLAGWVCAGRAGCERRAGGERRATESPDR